VHGELIVVDDVPGEFAERVIEAFHARPNDGFSLAVSGGPTARRCYERLADDAGTQIDWWKVDVYWGDERCVPHDSLDSNYHLVREALLERVGAVNANYPMFCEEGPDAYQLRLGELGRLDVVHLGLGADGHVASLFPESAGVDADPGRLVVMNDDPTGANAHPRMTLTFAGIARARLAIVTVEGEVKREALARVQAEDPTCPGSRVRADQVVWIADRAAAG
jgi:6-phosphogluconolactonase